jgi:hypothetical protein
MRLPIPLAVLAAAACNADGPGDSNITIDSEVNAAEAAGSEIETLPPDETVDAGDPDAAEVPPPENMSR